MSQFFHSLAVFHASTAGATLFIKNIRDITGIDTVYAALKLREWQQDKPELCIDLQDRDKTADIFDREMGIFLKENSGPHLIDSYYSHPKNAHFYIRNNCRVVGMGFPNADPHEKAIAIATNPPIYYGSDLENERENAIRLQGAIQQIEISRQLEQQCREFGIPFIDTSYNFRETIAENAAVYAAELKPAWMKNLPQ